MVYQIYKFISGRCAVAFFADGGDGVIGDGMWFGEGFGVGEVVSAAVSTTQGHIANSAFYVVGCVVLNETGFRLYLSVASELAYL